MATERVFSDEELRLGSTRSIDLLSEALAGGDLDAANRFVRRLRREVLSMIRNYAGWEVTLLRWIEQRTDAGRATEARSSIEDDAIAPERGGDGSDPVERWKARVEEIGAAIAAGQHDQALDMARALHDEALVRHDRGMSRVSALLSWIGRNFDIDGLGDALGEAMSADMLGDASFRERAEALMHFTRVHLQSFRLTEDDEKLTFECPVCPSGGRMIRAGHYSAPRNDLIVKGPHPLTYGRDEIPAYCCHEPIMEIASIEKTGEPLFIVEPAEVLGEAPCKTHLYKDRAAIPDHYYERLGLEKPTPE